MPHFLQKKDRWGNGLAVWVLALLVFLIPLGLWSIRKIEMHNDVTTWLPEDDPQARILGWYQDTFPPEERVLVSWDGSALDDPRLLQLARLLEGVPDSDGNPQDGSPYVKSVLTPHKLLGRMRDVPTKEAMEDRLSGILVGRGPLKLQLTNAGRKRGRFLFEELAEKSRAFGIELEAVDLDGVQETTQVDEDDAPESDDENVAAVTEYIQEEPPFDLAVWWSGMHHSDREVERFINMAMGQRGVETEAEPLGQRYVKWCGFGVGSPAALAVTLNEAGMEDREQVLAEIREKAASVGIPAKSLRLGGRTVAGHELNEAVKRAGWNKAYPGWYIVRRSPILFSFLVTVLCSFLLLKSTRLAALVLSVSLFTVFLAVSVVPVTGGSMNMVLIVMPTLLMVLTTSAAIHLANYWRNSAATEDPQTAVFSATTAAMRPCILAGLTTAVGLLSLCTSTLIPVRDFGIYSAVGCVFSLFMVLLGLPALMLYLPAKSPKPESLKNKAWESFGNLIHRYHMPVIVGCLLVAAVSCYGFTWFRTETKVIRYFPPESRIVQDYNFLEENLSGIVPVDTVVRFDAAARDELNFLERMELVRRIQTSMEAHPEVTGAVSLASFNKKTSRPPQPKSGLSLPGIRYAKTANRMEEALHDSLRMSAYIHGQLTAQQQKNFEAEMMADPDLRATVQERREVGWETSFSSLLAVARESADLHEAGDAGLARTGDELWRISAQARIMSDQDYGVLIADLNKMASNELKMVGSPGAGHQVTGLIPVFLRTQEAVLESLIRSFALAFVVIAIVMMCLLRNPLAGILTMVPNLLPVAVVFGLLCWSGLRIDIGTMITASVALGIAVDGTLHLLTWFRRQIEAGDDRKQAVAKSLAHCGPAMLQTSAAIGLGMLVLMPVELLLVSRFGWLMAALIGTALVADIVLLPAMLSGFLGGLIERSIKGSNDEDEPDPTSGDDSEKERVIPRPHVLIDSQPDRNDPSPRLRHG